MDYKNSMIFKKVTNKEEALKLINEAAFHFFAVAVIQVVFGFILKQNMWFEAGAYLFFAFVLKQFLSRIAAVLLMLLSVYGFVMSILMKMNLAESGGTNVILSALILFLGYKTVDGAFKYYKFKAK